MLNALIRPQIQMGGAIGTSTVVVIPGHPHGHQHRHGLRTAGFIPTASELHPRITLSTQTGVEFRHTRHAATSRHAAIGPGESPAAATFGCVTHVDAGALMEGA